MKNRLTVLVCLVAFVLAHHARQTALAGPTATENGDANGDGRVDIGDPVYLLVWLFRGGPPPVECSVPRQRNGDVNGDGRFNLADAAFLLNWLFVPGSQAPVSCENLDFPDFTLLGENVQGYREYSHDQTGTEFVLLPEGEFDMGSPFGELKRANDEGPVHTVTVSSFLIAKYEVTQIEYGAVLIGHSTLPAFPSSPVGFELPVNWVSWDEVKDPDGFLARCFKSASKAAIGWSMSWQSCRVFRPSPLTKRRRFGGGVFHRDRTRPGKSRNDRAGRFQRRAGRHPAAT